MNAVTAAFAFRSFRRGRLLRCGGTLAATALALTIGFVAQVVSCGSHYKDLSGPVFGDRIGTFYADLVPKSWILGPLLEPTGAQNGTQNAPRAPQTVHKTFPRAPQERPRPFWVKEGLRGSHFGPIWDPLGPLWGHLRPNGDSSVSNCNYS